MNRRRAAAVAVCALVIIASGWALTRTQSPNPTPTDSARICPLATLPPEVGNTVRLIHRKGPFPFPRDDGAVFGNREGHLPDQHNGYYREYTVITPGAQSRSARRIITGGTPVTDPGQYFYTADHYNSFCLVAGAGEAPSYEMNEGPR